MKLGRTSAAVIGLAICALLLNAFFRSDRERPKQGVRQKTWKWGDAVEQKFVLRWVIDSSAKTGSLPTPSSGNALSELHLLVDGNLHLTQIKVNDDKSFVVFAKVVDATIKVDGNAKLSRDNIATALADGAFIQLDALGVVNDVTVMNAISDATESLAIWRNLWGNLQLRWPSEEVTLQDQMRWDTEESDTNGDYSATYLALIDGTTGTIKKEKRHYSRDGHRRPLTADNRIESRFNASWRWQSGAGWPTELNLTEVYQTTIAGRDLAEGKTSLTLLAVTGAEVIGESRRQLLYKKFKQAQREGAMDNLAGSRAWESLARLQAKQYLGSNDDSTLTALVNSELARSDEPQLTTPTFLALRARFFLDDAAVDVWREAIKQWGHGDPRSIAVAETMAAAGTPACQAALVDIIKDERENEAVVARLLPALGMVDQPTDESISFLKGLASDDSYDSRASALLSLGIAGQRYRLRNPVSASALYDDLVGRYAKSLGNDRGLMIAALGNLGDRRQVGLVAPILLGSDVPLKIDAVRSLRFVESEARDDALGAVFTNEADSGVREAAAYAMSFGANSFALAIQRKVLLTEREPAVAQQLVHNIAAARNNGPENVEILKWVEAEHFDANTRRLAASYLVTATK